MIHLSQQDPRWANAKLGKSNVTVGRFGCTTTAISMLSDYFGCYKDPGELAMQQDLYTPDGYIIWANLRFDKMQFEDRLRGSGMFAEVNACLRDPNRAVILEVNGGAHWVTALRKHWWPGSNDYVCLDPWTGRKCLARGVYKNITGAATFSRKLSR